MLKPVCVLRLVFITQAPPLSILLQVFISTLHAGYFFFSTPHQSPQASHAAAKS